MLCLVAMQAQTTTTKLPKLRYQDGFLSTKYEIADKPASATDIGLHLEKTNPDANHHWRQAKSLETQATVFLLLGTGGLFAGLLLKNEKAKIAGYAAGGGFALIGLVTAIGSGSHEHKAFEEYNRAAGY